MFTSISYWQIAIAIAASVVLLIAWYARRKLGTTYSLSILPQVYKPLAATRVRTGRTHPSEDYERIYLSSWIVFPFAVIVWAVSGTWVFWPIALYFGVYLSCYIGDTWLVLHD